MLKPSFFYSSLLILFFSFSLTAQSPYAISWKNELPYVTASAATIGLGAYLRTLPPLFTPDELMTLDPQDINGFDRIATGNFSEYHDRVSDIFWVGSHLTPYLFLTGKDSRSHFGQIMAMYGEAATLNLGLTVIAKAAFLSGHASMTAVNSFFVA